MKITCTQTEANELGKVIDVILKAGGAAMLDITNKIVASIAIEPVKEVTLEESPCQNTNASTKKK